MLFTTLIINPISKVLQHLLSPAFHRHCPSPLRPAFHDHDNPQQKGEKKQLANKQ